MEIFEVLQKTNSTNEKQVILKNNLNPLVESMLRATYNDQVYGLNTPTLLKVCDFTKEQVQGYLDIAEYILQYPDNIWVSEGLDLELQEFLDIIDKCIQLSGNTLISYLKDIKRIYSKVHFAWLCRVLLKDLKIGMGLKLVNNVFIEKGLIPIFKFQVQLCEKLPISNLEKKVELPVALEIKQDGMRVIAKIEKYSTKVKDFKVTTDLMSFGSPESDLSIYNIKLLSRSGKDCTNQYPEIVRALNEWSFRNNINSITLDGEVISKDFQTLQKRFGVKSDNLEEDLDLRYMVFDITEKDGGSLKSNAFINRRTILKLFTWDGVISLNPIRMLSEYSLIIETYEDTIGKGYEGVVLKDLQGTYAEDSTDERKGQWKLKPQDSLDLEIINWEYGTGKYSSTIGSITVKNQKGDLVSNIGTGLKDKDRDNLLDLVENDKLLGSIVELKYGEITKPNEEGIRSLRWPVFIRIRDDKLESD